MWFVTASAVAFGGLSFLLRRRSLDWDGIALILRSERDNWRDFAHLLYPFLVRISIALGNLVDLSRDDSVRLMSIVAASATLILIWRLAERVGIDRVPAGFAAVLFSTAPVVWRQSLSAEVYAVSLAFLLTAAHLAMEAGERPSSRWRPPLTGAVFLLAAATHIGACFALPWILRLLGTDVRLAARRFFATLASVVLLVGVVGALWVDWRFADITAFARHIAGFLSREDGAPGFSSKGPFDLLRLHLHYVRRFLSEEALVLSVTGIVALVIGMWSARRSALMPLILGAPFLIAYVVLGVPMLGLLLPVLLALGLATAATGGVVLDRVLAAASPRRRSIIACAIAVILVAQWATALPGLISEARDQDPLAVEAQHLAEKTPPNAVLFTGRAAMHLRYRHPSVAIVSLPEYLHGLRAEGESTEALTNRVRSAAALEESRGRTPLMDTTGCEALLIFGVPESEVAAILDLSMPVHVGDGGRPTIFRIVVAR